MKPRLILKTHSGVRRPGIFSVLITKCTSPTRPVHQDSVIKKLALELKDISQEELKGAKFGERGAAFHAVWMAKPEQLGFLTSNMFWSWKGHVIRMLNMFDATEDVRFFLDLNNAEQVIFLKYYIEGDGAILLALAKEMLTRGDLRVIDLINTDLIEDLFHKIWQEYMEMSTNISERVRLREKLKMSPYLPSTRRHKIYSHLVPLEDIGLIVRQNTDQGESFTPKIQAGEIPLETLVERLGSVHKLETAIEYGEHAAVIAQVLYPKFRNYDQGRHQTMLIKTVLEQYQKLRQSGTPSFPIAALADAAYALMLAEHNTLVMKRDVEGVLTNLQTEHPREFTFQVDRYGLPSYIVISDEILYQLLLKSQ